MATTTPAKPPTSPVDAVFRGLADPTRRKVFERLSDGPASVMDLARGHNMALPSFVGHLKVMEQYGLVRSRKQGRVRTYQVVPRRVRVAEDWLDRQRHLWERRLDQLDDYLVNLKEGLTTMETTRIATPDPKLDLVLERTVDVPPELVWKAWTEPEHVKQFFVPRPWTITECDIDLRPGGEFRAVMRSPEGEEATNRFCYLELIPNKRLVWTDALLPGYRPAMFGATAIGFPLTAVITMAPDGKGGCHYTATAIHGSESDRQQHEAMGFHDGWGTVLDQLVEFARTL